MSRRPRVCVLQVPPFDPELMLGGAEVIAVHLVRGLTTTAEVTVLHGAPASAPLGSRSFPGLHAQVLAAFPIDEQVRVRGHVRPGFTAAARHALTSADVVITVERTLADPISAARIACLGGVGYPHTLDVLHHRAWDRLIVPSPCVARQVTAHVPQAHGVTVVENGLDLDVFTPPRAAEPSSRSLRLLVASRPGWDKGFRRAIALTRALEISGRPITLVCFAQSDGFGAADFASELRSEAHGLRLEILPWRRHIDMPAVFHRADLTLCLGEAAEGFGLVAAESVACGTPVLAHPVGFLAEMLPPGHGLHLVASDADTADLVSVSEEALAHGPQRCRALGRPYITARYGLDRMANAFGQLVHELVTG